MHYPSHLRERFVRWVDEGMPDVATVEINYEVSEEPARDFAMRFLGCTDLMPRRTCDRVEELLELREEATTYHSAASCWLQQRAGLSESDMATDALRRLGLHV